MITTRYESKHTPLVYQIIPQIKTSPSQLKPKIGERINQI